MNKISEKINKIKYVKKSNVIIYEKTTLIGIEIENKNMKKENMQDNDIMNHGIKEVPIYMRRKIEQEVKSVNPEIENIMISHNEDIFKKIKELVERINNGTPIDKLSNEIKDTMNQMEPERIKQMQ